MPQKQYLSRKRLDTEFFFFTSSISFFSLPSEYDRDNDDPDIAKIKKVQSFFRGWLCRRRWKQIVEQYINSPHADSMRKRNWWERDFPLS